METRNALYFSNLIKDFSNEIVNRYVFILKQQANNELHRDQNSLNKHIDMLLDKSPNRLLLITEESILSNKSFIAYFYKDETERISDNCLEEIIIQEKYKPLFSDYILTIAKQRLEQVNNGISNLKGE